MKSKILKMLLEKQNYISGQKICEELGVSRTTVWKIINQLKEDGYEIESVTNKGYRILTTPNAVTREAVESRMSTKEIARKVVYQDEVDSTNMEAKRLAEKKDSHGLLVIAESQSQGKGRRGRNWESPKGMGIWMSLILKPQIEPIHASMLTLVTALAAAKGIEEETGLEAKIKWPNDIVINGKKICGILTEMSSEVDYIHYVIVGIGINANTEIFPDQLCETASSLYLEGEKRVERASLICKIMKNFETYYLEFLKTQNLQKLLEEYNSLLVNKGKTVRVLGAQEEIIGIAKGINEKGELLIEVEGTIIPIISGEVSVRGLYGYV
ncbi:MAG: biotin--[acetyl-CoA-carboxylase] ligase [Acetivibrio sp.]